MTSLDGSVVCPLRAHMAQPRLFQSVRSVVIEDLHKRRQCFHVQILEMSSCQQLSKVFYKCEQRRRCKRLIYLGFLIFWFLSVIKRRARQCSQRAGCALWPYSDTETQPVTFPALSVSVVKSQQLVWCKQTSQNIIYALYVN